MQLHGKTKICAHPCKKSERICGRKRNDEAFPEQRKAITFRTAQTVGRGPWAVDRFLQRRHRATPRILCARSYPEYPALDSKDVGHCTA